jgi:3-phenylpropionate/trans-cinnamate dioxygenase ferredoxin reductase subunit
MAASARESGYEGAITLIAQEDADPYQKPPLSKEFLLENVEPPTFSLRTPAFYRDRHIDLRLATKVSGIDTMLRRVRTEDEDIIEYEWLGIATGSRARTLQIDGAGLDGVCTLRSMKDAHGLRQRLLHASSVAVAGGGFIGLEVAAAAASLGKDVTVIELQSRILKRSVGEITAGFLAGLHARSGVEIHTGTGVRCLQGANGRVCALVCDTGMRVPADLVVVGAGSLPNDELASEAGIRTRDGILVDAFGRSSDPWVVAAGDCTRFQSRYADAPVRLESVQNATEQARSAGATVAGRAMPYEALPWFWSVQYGCRLQMAGLAEGFDRAVLRGDPRENAFSVLYFRQDQLIAGDSVNRVADHMALRSLIPRNVRIDPTVAADPAVDLRSTPLFQP